MKGLIDHYIVSLEKIEKDLRKTSIKKAKESNKEFDFKEVSDRELNYKISQILEGY